MSRLTKLATAFVLGATVAAASPTMANDAPAESPRPTAPAENAPAEDAGKETECRFSFRNVVSAFIGSIIDKQAGEVPGQIGHMASGSPCAKGNAPKGP